ncbi:MAG: hypothetical protein PHR82_03695 [Endomicrobiaceae bacterium]|nr:hypothetical protein [Endomicrobiaceae bacterium]
MDFIFNEKIDISDLNKRRHLKYNLNNKEYHFLNTDLVRKENEANVYDVYETRYQNGFRYTKSDLGADKEYIFLGCSFTYGVGLEDTQTLPYIFSKKLNYKYGVLNCGVSGSGSNTALNMLKSDILKFFIKQDKPIKHFIYMAIYDHITRNFTDEFSYKSSDNYVYENNKFIKIRQPFGFFTDTFARSYIFREFFLDFIENKNETFYENYFIKSLEEMDSIIKEKYNSKFTVLLWNDEQFCFEKEFIEKMQSTNLDFIILPKFTYKYIIPNDVHPNEKANEEIAKILLKHFEEQDKKDEK